MNSVDGEQIKQAYLKLPGPERREVAHWILARELSGRAGASFQSTDGQASGKSSSNFFYKTILMGAAALLLVAALALSGIQWMSRQEHSQKKQSSAQRAAEESKRPNSPANMDFLARNVGNEILIRGIPEDSEIGYLYFSKSRKKALRLNLFVGGVVLLQSGELEEWVRNKQEIEVQGLLEKTADGYYQISVPVQSRLKRLP